MRFNPSPGLEALVLPRPQLLRNPSSLSSLASSPHTPQSPSCLSSFIFSQSNRNSNDSWNSSNGPDDLEWDWKPDQVRLLTRTLDALPPHLVTPFNGPIPPSNLLDKIARGISDAKGPIDWPHSIRATRVKLIELSRVRAKEQAQQIIIQEPDDDPTYTRQNYSLHRPLYRQSSMEFIDSVDLKENNNIACFSDRLQRVDRPSNSAHHPYSRNTSRTHPRRLSSPIRPRDTSSIATPSTPSSSTLNSLSSFSAPHNRVLQRTSSNISFTSASSLSMGSGDALPDPRVQRVKRSDSFCAPVPPPKDVKVAFPLKEPTAGIKRPSSFGTLALEVRRDIQHAASANEAIKDLSCPSSDEEEKIRSKGAKKIKVKEPVSADKKVKTKSKDPASPDRKVRVASPRSHKPKPHTDAPKEVSGDVAVSAKGTKRVPPVPMNLHRNPSIFGPELPHLRSTAAAFPPQSSRTRVPTSPAPQSILTISPVLQKLSASPEIAPAPPKGKTLRRVQRKPLGRRISFGSLVGPGDDADAESDDEDGGRFERQRQRELGQLGSAFQLQ